MFSRKFWMDAGDTFGVAALAVLATDADVLIAAGSWEQAGVIVVSLGRAAVIAGFKAVGSAFRARRAA